MCGTAVWIKTQDSRANSTWGRFDQHFRPGPEAINKFVRIVVVAQLAERSLLMPEVQVSNPVIGNIS